MRGLVAGLVMLATLTGCGGTGLGTGTARSVSNPDALEKGDVPLNQAPASTVVVPHSPTHAPNPMTGGNSGTLYVSAPETLPALKRLISEAKHSVYLETFNFGNDSMGQQVIPLLVAQAKAGLEVKVVCDYVGTRFLPHYNAMAHQLRDAGVDFRLYKPRTIIKDDKRHGINITHRKVYLADGERALIGGVNLMKPFDTDTQDVLVEWHGPLVAQAYAEYCFDWKSAGGGALGQQPLPSGNAGSVKGRVVVTSAPEGRFEARDAIYQAVDGAQREIRIENQYLWDDRLVSRLDAALKRGVKMRLVVPGEEDHGIYKRLHADELKRLTDAGAEARLYTGIDATAHLHVKYFGIDDQWVAIGSANGDTRGLLDNQELDTVIIDPVLGQGFKERLFEKDWASYTKPFVYKPSSVVVRPFASLIEILDYYL